MKNETILSEPYYRPRNDEKTLAAHFAKHGLDVALIEESQMMYTCINVVCIPTESVVSNAEKQIPY